VFIGAAGLHAKVGDYANPATRNKSVTPIVLALISVAVAVTLTLAI
jgi:hypothetical protein